MDKKQDDSAKKFLEEMIMLRAEVAAIGQLVRYLCVTHGGMKEDEVQKQYGEAFTGFLKMFSERNS